MKSSKIVQIILNVIVIALFLGAGVTVLVLRRLAESYDSLLLGTVLLVVGGVKGAIYIISKGYKYHRNITFVSALAMISLGIVFLVSDRDMETLCFGWGMMELVLGAIEVYIDILEIKETKIAFAEMAINIGTIVFAILLCIRMSAGLTGHLIFLGVSLILLAALQTFKFIRSLRSKE